MIKLIKCYKHFMFLFQNKIFQNIWNSYFKIKSSKTTYAVIVKHSFTDLPPVIHKFKIETIFSTI